MRNVEIVVIGGGATGAGVLRDASLRGFRALLVERGELAGGTTLRQHGVLHSGARYAVSDPEAARECIEENRILRKIAAPVLNDTGGLVVSTPEDDLGYIDKLQAACAEVGIPAEHLQPNEALRLEPALNPHLHAGFRVPDAHCDARDLVRATVESAQRHGGQVCTGQRVVGFERTGASITTVRLLNSATGQEETIACDLVVNAAGAWAGQVSALADITIPMAPDKGSMLVFDSRLNGVILHRCHLPGDGDIIVPVGSTSVAGTTSVPVSSPDDARVEPWEIDLLNREADILVPGLSRRTRLGAYAGVRPLFGGQSEGRDRGRGFILLEHGPRDGIGNMLTIVSGKLTTHRLMAEATIDAACRILRTNRPCRTAIESLL